MPSRPTRSRSILLVASLATLVMAVQVAMQPAVAAPAAADEVPDAFLARLLDEINERRADAGTGPLTYAPARAGSALGRFLAASSLAGRGGCGHPTVDGAYAEEHVRAAGFQGEARGEVLACPSTEPYWTPARAADAWWDSPMHFEILYADPDATAIVCGAHGVTSGKHKRGRASDAARVVLCITFRT